MSLDKDIEKMTQKLKGKKRRFRIEAGYRGGEVGIGKVKIGRASCRERV